MLRLVCEAEKYIEYINVLECSILKGVSFMILLW